MSASLADDELLITRSFDAPAALLFGLWTQADHFTRWMGPEGFQCLNCTLDARVGGAYRALMRSKETGDTWFSGVYRELDPPTKLVFTFQWETGPSARIETLVTILFREHDGKTVMTFHQTPFLDVAARDRHVGGWSSAFDRLGAYAGKMREKHA
jgi:uncharacterized protein YndB with AHSA1/START domain